jgi:cytochrome c-type biogenesis protein CcmH
MTMRRPLRIHLAALLAALAMGLTVPTAAPPAFAVEPSEILKDPTLELRARKLSAELRCVVCQNQSIDDSNAPLAKDLRVLVRERLVAGDSDREVLSFVVARYGEFVLLRPPIGAHTIMLWAAPALVLLGVMVWIGLRLRRPAPVVAPVALSAEERRRLDALLADETDRTAADITKP